ncbi:hypothetical protein FA95DRAFT_1684034, partial [Auriscalpium vulgare]
MPENVQRRSRTQPTSSRSEDDSSDDEHHQFNQIFVDRANTFVEDFRRGKRNKALTTKKLLELLSAESSAHPGEHTQAQLDHAFQSYFDQIEQIERAQRAAEERGRPRGRKRTEVSSDERAGYDGDYESEEDSESSGDENQAPRKRMREDDGDEGVTGKRPLDESLLPFMRNAPAVALSPSQLRTLELKSNYLRDLSGAKQLILSRPDCPAVPLSIWKDVLSSAYVDLDKVFSGHYALDGDPRGLHKLGDFELVLGSSKPDRHIRSHGDWMVAWTPYADAVTTPPRELSVTTKASGHESAEPTTTRLEIFTNSTISSLNTSSLADREAQLGRLLRRRKDREGVSSFAASSMLEPVPTTHVAGDIDAQPVEGNMLPSVAPATPLSMRAANPFAHNGSKGPRLYRGYLWETSDDFSYITPSATATETADPIPGPPLSARSDPVALSTLRDHPSLFQIVTPINVDRFEALLTSHPNRPFVESVLRGLREGFWPFAEGDPDAYPEVRDFPERHLSPEDLEFAEAQCLEEERLERFSPPFGSPGGRLFPGMCNVPVHAVPKKSGKLRLVVDHSAGEFSPNSHINHDDVHVRLDTVQHLAHNLIAVRQRHGSIPLWLWKSDVQQAYRRIPMHPLWQLRQIVTVKGVRRVDRCNNFGGRASAKLWCAFMSLVLWIGINVMLIEALLAYIDDSYAFDLSTHLAYYEPYDDWYPESQVRFLQLWDFIGLPHEKAKQEFGRTLVIIGFHVDPIRMTVSLSSESRAELVAAIHSFLDAPGRKRRLVEWQRMLGRSIRNAPIYINADVTRDWMWFADILQDWSGVHVMRARHWGPAEAELTIYCDASSVAMGFWAPARSEGFVSNLPRAPATADTIFWFEASCVLAALEWATSLPDPPRRLAIYTDNLNTVQIFNSFKAHDAYNDILLWAARLLINSGLDLRVFHIAGEDNIVADALSRHLFDVVMRYAPRLRVFTFQPP